MAPALILNMILAMSLFSASTSLRSDRDDSDENLALNTTDAEDFDPRCADYCVKCHDGSSIWYGRSRNWFKVGATSVLGSVGIAASVSGVGAVGVVAAAGAGAALGVGEGISQAEETHTHWSANIPTSGMSCERVDVLRFFKGSSDTCASEYLMQKSAKWLGRVVNNQLKPYDENGDPKTGAGFIANDDTAYKKGCKIVKAAGMSGSLKQFTSNFQSYCDSDVTKAASVCSTHNKLCGPGGVSGVTDAKTADQCLQQCSGEFESQVKCRA